MLIISALIKIFESNKKWYILQDNWQLSIEIK